MGAPCTGKVVDVVSGTRVFVSLVEGFSWVIFRRHPGVVQAPLGQFLSLSLLMDLSRITCARVIMLFSVRATLMARIGLLRVIFRAFRQDRLADMGRSAITGRTRLVDAFSLALLGRASYGDTSLNSFRDLTGLGDYNGLLLSLEDRRALRDVLGLLGDVMSSEMGACVGLLFLDRFTDQREETRLRASGGDVQNNDRRRVTLKGLASDLVGRVGLGLVNQRFRRQIKRYLSEAIRVALSGGIRLLRITRYSAATGLIRDTILKYSGALFADRLLAFVNGLADLIVLFRRIRIVAYL